MMKLNIQLFASKKGVGSSSNGRDSIAKDWCKNCRWTNCNAGSII